MGNNAVCQVPVVVCEAHVSEACEQSRLVGKSTTDEEFSGALPDEVMMQKARAGENHVDDLSVYRDGAQLDKQERSIDLEIRGFRSQSGAVAHLAHVMPMGEKCANLGQDHFCVELVTGPSCLPLSITVSPDDDPTVLTIDEIFSPGLIDAWNKSKSSKDKVYPGDMIICVNGVDANAVEMLELLSARESSGTHETLDLFIRPGRARRLRAKDSVKPEIPNPEATKVSDASVLDPFRSPFVVSVVMGPGCLVLGLAVVESASEDRLIVEAVWSSGLIARWNAGKPERQQLQKGDFITSVNDKVAQHQSDMLHEVYQTQTACMERSMALKLHILPGQKQEMPPAAKPKFF